MPVFSARCWRLRLRLRRLHSPLLSFFPFRLRELARVHVRVSLCTLACISISSRARVQVQPCLSALIVAKHACGTRVHTPPSPPLRNPDARLRVMRHREWIIIKSAHTHTRARARERKRMCVGLGAVTRRERGLAPPFFRTPLDHRSREIVTLARVPPRDATSRAESSMKRVRVEPPGWLEPKMRYTDIAVYLTCRRGTVERNGNRM